jgi:hypothetical protein
LAYPQVKPEEMKTLVAILNNTSGAVDKAHAEGVHVNGERYVVTRIEERSVYARQVRSISGWAFQEKDTANSFIPPYRAEPVSPWSRQSRLC